MGPLVVIVILCATKTCSNHPDNENVMLHLPWNTTTFCEQGSPLITREFEQRLRMKSREFIPKYFVLGKTYEIEENMYVFLENLNNTLFYLYGPTHPDADSYKINITSSRTHFIVEKCNKSQICKKLVQCDQACIQRNINLDLSDMVVYISWRKISETLFVIIQHRDRYIRCTDAVPNFEIRKLVMWSTERQKISVEKYKYNIATTNNSWPLENKFNITANNSVFIQGLQCLDCEMNFLLQCNNFSENVTTRGSESPNVTFQNNFLLHGWNDLLLPKKIKPDVQLNNCNLTIKTSYDQRGDQDYSLERFWIIGQSVANINVFREDNENATLTANNNAINENDRRIINMTFDLGGDDSLFIKTLQCPICTTEFRLECDKDFIDNVTINNFNDINNSSNATFEWTETTFPNKTKLKREVNNCTLTIKEGNEGVQECSADKLWVIVQRVTIPKIVSTDASPDLSKTTTGFTESTSTPKNSPSPPTTSTTKGIIQKKTNINALSPTQIISNKEYEVITRLLIAILALIILLLLILLSCLFGWYYKKRKYKKLRFEKITRSEMHQEETEMTSNPQDPL